MEIEWGWIVAIALLAGVILYHERNVRAIERWLEHGEAPDPPRIEREQAEPLLLEFPRDEARDQKTRDDEKGVDADKAARHHGREGMKVQHQHHRDGAQAIDIRPVF